MVLGAFGIILWIAVHREDRTAERRIYTSGAINALADGHGIGSGLACYEFEPSTYKDPPCRGAMRVKSVKRFNVLPLVWCTGVLVPKVLPPRGAGVAGVYPSGHGHGLVTTVVSIKSEVLALMPLKMRVILTSHYNVDIGDGSRHFEP
ncbi:hypothetical protein TNCV_132881 [Trichonephila clavipes]|nr:hypothetical protein TNCV_132881 [Trichonephila clavipes]